MTDERNRGIDERELNRIRAESMDFADVGLYRYRFDGEIVFFDRGALRLLDIEDRFADPAEVVGRKIGELFEYVDPPHRLRDALRTHGVVRDFEYRYRTLTGKLRWVYHNSYIVEDQTTGEQQIQVIARDITLLKQTAAALEASNRRYRTLAETLPQGIGVLQGEPLRVVFANPALARLLAVDGAAVHGLSFERLRELIDPRDRAQLPTAAALAGLGERGLACVDCRLADAGDAPRWVVPTFLPIDFDGAPAYQLTLLDTTERLEAERRRRRLEDEMRHAQKLESLGVLAGGIAHDFNNLLAGVLGNAELAGLRMGDQVAVRRHLDAIGAAANRAAELCQQLLAYSGRHRLTIEAVDLNRLIDETGPLLEMSISKRARLRHELSPQLPLAEGDPSQLRQVLMNLIINASEAIGERPGTITLRTGLREYASQELAGAHFGAEREPGSYLYLEVEDDGAGMDARTRRRLFEPFFTTKFTGRGLGLAAVRGIVRGHGGAIFVDSERGAGTRFRVLLPVGGQTAQSAVPPPPDGVRWRGSGKVLVVDDEAVIRVTTCAMLEVLGFVAVPAANGVEAIEQFREHQGDFVLALLDVLMPESDGRECFGEMRRLSPRLPVVFISGYGEEIVAREIEADPRVRFLQKPFGLGDLLARLRELFE